MSKSKSYTNAQISEMHRSLQPFLSRKDMIGYVAARNCRILGDCLTEYNKFRDDLVRKYGAVDHDEEGNELPSFSIKISSPEFKAFNDELTPLNNVEQELDLIMLKYNDIIGQLTGEEILTIDWMMED